MEEQGSIESFEMKLSESAKVFLKETAKWAYFLSILGFIGIGFIIFAALFAGTLFSSMSKMNPAMGAMGSSFGIVMAFFYFMIAVLYFSPVYYLNKFASNAKKAFKNSDSEILTISLEYLKSHYKYIGIMTLVIFSLYFLMFIGMIIAGMSFNDA